MKMGLVGSGKMAEAMLRAWLRTGQATPAEVVAADVSAERRETMARSHGIRCTATNAEAVTSADLVLLAVKPQHLQDAVKDLPRGAAAGRLVMSILAGKRMASIQTALPGARVVRVMPNLPCLVGEGMSAWCAGPGVTPVDRAAVEALLGSFGLAVELPEDRFDAVTALSGSGPAFFAWVMDRMCRAAIAEGLAADEALAMATQTMLGTARLLREQKLKPAELIQSVASAKGTTAAGLAVLDASEAGAALEKTISAAAARSRELSS